MAIKFMGDHENGDFGANYDALTFAAPAYGLFDGFVDDNRILHFEINGDLTPDLPGFHPGRNIHFEGNETQVFFTTIVDNHSMDYYRQITDSIDADTWTQILAEPGEPEIFLGGEYVRNSDDDITNYIVDGYLSGTHELANNGNDELTDPYLSDFEIYYGGIGNDILTGGSDEELMLGGTGDDKLTGSGGNDRLTGGLGFDHFIFNDPDEGLDIIADFTFGEDKLVFLGSEFENITLENISANALIVNSAPTPINNNPVFLFNTNTSILSFDEDGIGDFFDDNPEEIVKLAGIYELNHTDFLIV
jgi:Ca2+-binding RTX toxin-like protein